MMFCKFLRWNNKSCSSSLSGCTLNTGWLEILGENFGTKDENIDSEFNRGTKIILQFVIINIGILYILRDLCVWPVTLVFQRPFCVMELSLLKIKCISKTISPPKKFPENFSSLKVNHSVCCISLPMNDLEGLTTLPSSIQFKLQLRLSYSCTEVKMLYAAWYLFRFPITYHTVICHKKLPGTSLCTL